MLEHNKFIECWNEFTDCVQLGFCCHICRQQFDVVRDASGFSIGILCACPAVSTAPSFERAELN
jgi:hypothetical protein